MKHHGSHMKPIHHDQPKQAHPKVDITDHAHKEHRGPHHDMYIHDENKVSVSTGMKGSHELGDKSHLDSLKGEPHGADVSGHNGKMKW